MVNKKILKKINEFTKLVIKKFKVKSIILYGSYAKGTETKYSDIDIAVVFKNGNTNLFDIEVELFNLRYSIEPKIEPIAIAEDKDPAGFLAEIYKTGKIIYKAA